MPLSLIPGCSLKIIQYFGKIYKNTKNKLVRKNALLSNLRPTAKEEASFLPLINKMLKMGSTMLCKNI